ncbi:MAG: hypothetical protein ABI579_05155 [Candidatus Sumerlaeota bacterium]
MSVAYKSSWVESLPLAMAALGFSVFAVFALALKNDFLYWDDNIYTFQEPLVTNPAPATIVKILHSSHHGNYYPVTLLSFWIEYRIADMTPSIYHLTNLVLHILNTLICFRLLLRLSNNFKVAWLAALLFAIHPLRVEAIAWISARKDLLAALFYLSAMFFYVYTYRQERLRNHIIIFLLHAGALMSKGTAVTLPIALLLIDYYQRAPLRLSLLLKKIPLFALSLFFGVLAIRLQHDIGATDTGLPPATFAQRVGIASYASLFYFSKTIIPTELSAFYLYPVAAGYKIPQWFTWCTFVTAPLVASLLFVLRRNRAAIFGILFFFVAIGPVLQLLSVGAAIAADRYTYLPSVGLMFAVVSLFSRAFRHWPTILLLAACALVVPTVMRIRVWRDTETLMTDQIAKYPSSVFAWNDRGVARMALGRTADGFADYCVAVTLRPEDPDAKENVKRTRNMLEKGRDLHQEQLTP